MYVSILIKNACSCSSVGSLLWNSALEGCNPRQGDEGISISSEVFEITLALLLLHRLTLKKVKNQWMSIQAHLKVKIALIISIVTTVDYICRLFYRFQSQCIHLQSI